MRCARFAPATSTRALSRCRSPLLAAVLVLAGCATADAGGARIERFRFAGLDVAAVVPGQAPAVGHRGLVVFLHGRGGSPDDEVANRAFIDSLGRAGARAPVFVFPGSEEGSYWHDRRGHRWAQALARVTQEAIRRYGIDPRKVAFGGISMGGYGAWEFARTHPGALCAVAGHSPALWQSARETAPGAFDDAGDFARHDVIAAARRSPEIFARTPHRWLDAGTGDPFDPGDRALVGALRTGHVRLTVHRWPGGHDSAYWDAHWGAYTAWYAGALSTCH